jgi:hypothetical protein
MAREVVNTHSDGSVAYMHLVVDLLLLVLVDGPQQVHEARYRGVRQGDLVVLAQAGTGLLLWQVAGIGR